MKSNKTKVILSNVDLQQAADLPSNIPFLVMQLCFHSRNSSLNSLAAFPKDLEIPIFQKDLGNSCCNKSSKPEAAIHF